MNTGHNKALSETNSINDTQTCFYTEYSGKRYFISLCSEEIDAGRIKTLMKTLNSAVAENSCLIIPHIFEDKGKYYAASYAGPEALADLPAKYVRALNAGQKRRIVLSALGVVAMLERAGIIHGNIDRCSFQMGIAKDGAAIVRLRGIEHCGIVGKFPPIFSEYSDYAAPESKNNPSKVSFASDVFSLGMCLHFWLAGELPIYCAESERQHYLLSSCIPKALRPVIGMMLAPNPAHGPTASALLWMLQDSIKVKSAFTFRIYKGLYDDGEYSESILQSICSENAAFDPDFMLEEAKYMGWFCC